MNTTEILGAFRSGFAKANRYTVQLPATSNGQAMNVMCDSVTWPGRQISTVEIYTDMKANKAAYAFIPDDVTISFVMSNDWSAWNYLHDWHKRVIGNIEGDNGYRVNFKADYQRQIVIIHNDESENDRKLVVLKGAFPTTLSSMELSNQNENTVLRVTATFSYENWAAI